MAVNYDAWLERQAEKRNAAEVQVLGACMAYPNLVDVILARLEPAMFKRDAHRILAEAIWKLASEGQPVTMEAVTDRLIGTGRIDEVGGVVAVYDVYAQAEPSGNAVETLLAIQRRGKVWAACRDGMMASTNPAVDPETAAADVMASLVGSSDRFDDQAGGLTVDELVALEAPPWVVDEVIPAGMTVLYGNAKSGKSYLALSVAWSFATGTSWHRRTCRTSPGQVLYLSGEGLADQALRVRALIQSTDRHPGGNLVTDTQPLSLSRERDAAKLRLMVERWGAELVVVDTWARYSGLRDENDAAQASQAVAALEQLTVRGVSVIVVHHANTEGKLRGSTALGAAAESVIRVGIDGPASYVHLQPEMVRRGRGFSRISLKFLPAGPDSVLVEPWVKADNNGHHPAAHPQQTLV